MTIYLNAQTTWTKTHDTTQFFSGYIRQKFNEEAQQTYAYYQHHENATAAGIENMATITTSATFFEQHPDKHSYSALQNFFEIQARQSAYFLRDFCAEVKLCFDEYDRDSAKIQAQQIELFSGFNTSWQPPSLTAAAVAPGAATASQPVIDQQPRAQYLGPYGQRFNIPFDQAWSTLTLAFMSYVYANTDSIHTLTTELEHLYISNDRNEGEEEKLAKIIARAVCRYYYRFCIIQEARQADFRFATNPYACAWIGGSVVPSVILSVPIAATFISTIGLPLQIAFPGIFLVLGILLSQFDGQHNHEQDLDEFPVATREQRYKARAEWMLGCAAVAGTTAQALTPVALKSYIAQLIAGGLAATATTLVAPIGISLVTIAVTYFIINQLQACGYVKYSPIWSIGKPLALCIPGCATICDFASRISECFGRRRDPASTPLLGAHTAQ